MQPVARALLRPGRGLDGDRWQGAPTGARQVTLIAEEHLLAIARFLGRDAVAPEELRRNVVLGGINLLALKGHRVQLGSAVLEVSGECHPCSRMEEILGPGGYNAVRGQGGLTARVLVEGWAGLGDAAERLD